ncbi:TonB-dependent receptor domain-containing protein [uncultured Vibrio sp.]|uniref:TonB-dependent receptor domain-containing protein n=1 Tax=uncultured Vibrio sp. TaxID=114054 RepID=UPI002AA90729|nr:TonB-dependent receptor [uncultured Vibrio sp.]
MMYVPPFKLTPIALLIGTAVAFTSATHAEEPTTAENTDTAEVLSVWGTSIGDSTSLLSDDISMKQADHLSDLLRDQAGVDVGGTHSLNQSINIRGVSELDLDITIDGASQANNVFHHVGNLLINPDIIKAVDIQVGTNSVLNSGLGGGVAFETKDAKDLLRAGEEAGFRVNGGYASNDYYQYSGTGYAQLSDTIDALAYYSVIDRNNPEDGDGEKQVGEEGKTENYFVKFGWDANDINRLELSYDYYKDAGDYTLKSNMGNSYDHSNFIRPIEYTRETIALVHELALENTDVRSNVYFNEMNYQNKSPSTGDVGEGNTQVYGAKVLAETMLEIAGFEQTARYGAEGAMQEAKKVTNGSTVSGSKETADSFALYVEDEIALTDAWFVTPGARYNHYKVDMAASNDTFKDFTFALSTQYALTENWTLRAAATELFKGPGLTGSFISSGSSYNSDLKAETGVNYEAAIAYESRHVLGLDTLGFSFTAFETHIDDYIDDTMTAKASTYSNEGDVEIQGFESVLNMRKGDVSGRVTYSHSDSEFVNVNSSSSYVVGQSLDDEVGDSISLNIGYDIADMGVSVNWTSQWALDLSKDVEEDSAKDGYDVHDINVRWIPNTFQDLSITAAVENMFNEHYSSHASHDFGRTDYEPGRNFKLSAAYQF